MEILKTELDGVVIIKPTIFSDGRGWFFESYSENEMKKHGFVYNFVQDNHSLSRLKGTLRGIHFQNNPKSQSKLVRCTKGRIIDVAVDLRKSSLNYKKWICVELSDSNQYQLLIPKGFGHGFVTLTDDVEVQYKVDEYYSHNHDRSIRFDDPDLDIDWKVDNPILSEKDSNACYLKDSDINFD